MAVFDLAFSLTLGEFSLEVKDRADCRALGLFGPSGSGKTSVVEAIAGLLTPDRGHIAVGGRTLFSETERCNLPSRSRCVGYVPQDVLLFPHLDVRGNVLYARRGSPGITLDEVADLLEIDRMLDRRVAELSGGERQRVALARAMMAAPGLLLLDEPLAAVDVPRRRQILAGLQRFRDRLSLPIVYVTHAAEEACAITDRVLLLDRGRVTDAGDPRILL
jgi:molybdate transport system ATP-binding protein